MCICAACCMDGCPRWSSCLESWRLKLSSRSSAWSEISDLPSPSFVLRLSLSLTLLDDPDDPGSWSWRLALRRSCRPGCSNCLVCSCCRRPSWNLGFCCEEWKFHHFQQNWSKYPTLSKSQSISHFLPQHNNLAAKLTRLDFLFSAAHLHFPKSYQNLILSSISVLCGPVMAIVMFNAVFIQY